MAVPVASPQRGGAGALWAPCAAQPSPTRKGSYPSPVPAPQLKPLFDPLPPCPLPQFQVHTLSLSWTFSKCKWTVMSLAHPRSHGTEGHPGSPSAQSPAQLSARSCSVEMSWLAVLSRLLLLAPSWTTLAQ